MNNIQNLVKTLINERSAFSDPDQDVHLLRSLYPTVQKVFSQLNQSTEKDWNDLHEVLHFIDKGPIKSELNEALSAIGQNLLVSENWDGFWVTYDEIVTSFPTEIQDAAFLTSLKEILESLDKNKAQELKDFLLSLPPNLRTEAISQSNQISIYFLKKIFEKGNEERIEIIRQLHEISNSIKGISKLDSVFPIIIGLPKEIRSSVVNLAANAFNQKIRYQEMFESIRFFGSLTKEDRDFVDINNFVTKLGVERFLKDETTKLKIALKSIPLNERIDTFEILHRLNSGMTSKQIIFLSQVISAMTPENRGRIADLIQHFPVKNLDNSKKIAALAGYFLLPDLKAVKSMKAQEKITLASLAIDCLRLNNGKMDVLQYAKSFIDPNMTVYEIADILSLILNIPKDRRSRVIKHALEQINEKMIFLDKATLLHFISISSDEQYKIIMPYFSRDMHWTTKVDLLACRNIEDIERIINYPTKIKNESWISQFAETSDEDDLFENVEIDPHNFVRVPNGSTFADTDLVVCDDNFKGVLPKNGIRKSELAQLEVIFKEIKAGKSKFNIDVSDKKFKAEVAQLLKKLMTRSIGRKLIGQVLANPHILTLAIKRGDVNKFLFPNLTIEIDPQKEVWLYGQHPKGILTSYSAPPFISLGHELIHAANYPEGSHVDFHLEPNLGPAYENKGEQIVITGFSKDINLKDSKDSWEQFNPINERNLHAAFVDSGHLASPRYGHQGVARPNIHQSKEPVKEAFRYIISKISIHWNTSRYHANQK